MEFEEMLAVAINMGGGPALMYAAQALDAWEQFGGGPLPNQGLECPSVAL